MTVDLTLVDDEYASEEQIAQIIDAFGQRADVEAVALRKGIPVRIVRKMLDDPQIALKAIQRKKNELAFWFAGRVLDELQDMILAPDTKQSVKLAAIRLLRDLLSDLPEQAHSKSVEPASLEEALERAG